MVKATHELLARLNVGKKAEDDLIAEAFRELLTEPESDSTKVELGSILTGLLLSQPTVSELEIIFKTIFEFDNISPYNNSKYNIKLDDNEPVIGCVGSGKKGIKTINVSTTSGLIAAAAGCYVAKPGSKSVSSLTGSSDIMEELGVNVNLPIDEMADVLKETHFGLFKIENYLTHFGKLYNGRFHVPQVLSYALAALASPIHTDKLLYGFTHYDIETSLDVLNRFEYDDAMVISCTYDGIHYLDEFGIFGETRIIGSKNGIKGALRVFNPLVDLELPHYGVSEIYQGSSVCDNVQIVVDLLSGKGKDALEDIIAINSSALLVLGNKANNLRDGYQLAKKIIGNGSALEVVENLVRSTEGDLSQFRGYVK